MTVKEAVSNVGERCGEKEWVAPFRGLQSQTEETGETEHSPLFAPLLEGFVTSCLEFLTPWPPPQRWPEPLIVTQKNLPF